ncbi:GtrA-like protein [Legionella bozemanae]|uniref:GtrA-like protein n=2 Tax=Legionella bozemanae TaxID=447 RepID=A0A0W0RQ62_LEGBO|nr:GtrA-like protein [Legionella bozemanae]STO34566.1 GtrA-like protein [Legionella bozemanae]
MKIKFIQQADKKQMLGFAITGILSTLIMFGLYVMLYQFINYQYAYLIAYTISVVALYFMNKSVFKGIMSLETILEFPLIYLLQYVLGALSLEFIVWLGFSVTYAPLIIVIILLPVTFILNRIVFSKHKRSL